MRLFARIALLSASIGVLLVAIAEPMSAQASFGPEVFEDGTCLDKTCTYASVEKDPSEAFTQAAGHPPWGGTKFIMKHNGSTVEGSSVKRIRVDVPSGLAANPQAPAPKCSIEQFDKIPVSCPPSSEVGTAEMEAVAEPLGLLPVALPALEGKVYNLEQPPGLPLDFGIAVEPLGELLTPIHLFLEGHLSWAHEPSLQARGVPSGDYHEYFEIDNVPNEAEVKALVGVKSPLKVLMSKLNFNGHAGNDFLTLPSACSKTTTSYLELESWSKEVATTETHTPVGVEHCDKVPFLPTASLTPETSTSDEPDGVTVDVHAPQKTGPEEIDTADIQNAHVTLPEGLTLNPSAAHELQTCSPAQIAIGEARPVACPSGSRVGTVTIETDLPPHSLTGNVFLGDPSGAPIAGPPFTIYIEAESIYDVSVRLQGQVSSNPTTGRLEATFTENPPLPFSDLILEFKGGPRAPLANPLACETGHIESLFTPYTGASPAPSSEPFAATGCPSPLPFALSQTATVSNPNAGAHTNLTFNLVRADGQQYLSHVQTTLPEGLLADIPTVPLCPEPEAGLGTCPSPSQIGTATATVGSGSEPYSFTGPVYLTGSSPPGRDANPSGAPYGLSIPVPAAAGPFDLGFGPCDCVLTRASISVDPHTARVSVAANLPTIVAGVPLRLRTLSVSVEKPNFMFEPTGCDPRAYDTTLTSTAGSTQSLSTPFQATNCAALPFKPSFKLSTNAHTSKLGGASLTATLTQRPHEADLRSVVVQLPKQLPSRLTTLQKACPQAVFAANPVDCRPLGSEVGTATVTTPVLPGTPPGREANLSGSAYLVSHGGSAFPDLDLVLEGDNVTIELTGNTQIKNGVTSSTFAAIPDAPISSFTLDLPVGPHSALTATANLCAGRSSIGKLIAPTTIVGQNGAKLQQATRVSVAGCPAPARCPVAHKPSRPHRRHARHGGRTRRASHTRTTVSRGVLASPIPTAAFRGARTNHINSHSKTAKPVLSKRGHCRYGHQRGACARRPRAGRCAAPDAAGRRRRGRGGGLQRSRPRAPARSRRR